MSLDELERVYQSAVNTDPSEIFWSHWTDPEDIVKAIWANGIVVFRGYLDSNVVAQLNTEFDQIIGAHRSGNGPFHVDDYENLFNIQAVRSGLSPESMPVTCDVFGSPQFEAVAQHYFGDDEYRLNQQIFFTHLQETRTQQSRPPFALHFDKLHLFKFYIYLHDTDESTGAMRVAPGSNTLNRTVRLKALEMGYRSNLPNVPPVEIPSFPVTGPAGTLMIFDTDMCHGAGSVAAGKERRTVRGHSPAIQEAEQFLPG